MTFTDAVKRVMGLSGAVREYWERELPKRHPRWPLCEPDVDDGPPPPEQAELEALLASLPPEWVYALAALLRLGRGTIGVDELSGECGAGRSDFSDAEQAARILAAKATLGEYLGLALEGLARAGVDPDSLPRAPVAAAG